MSSASAILSHQESQAQGPISAAPELLPVPRGHGAPVLRCSKRDWAQLKFPVGCGELGAMVSPVLGSLTPFVSSVSCGGSL